MASPIIPWIGGKRRLADRLLPYFPSHQCYVEPFAGGAAMFFLRPVPADVEVLNDVNGELVNLYRVVKHHLEEFVRQFKWALSSRQVFKWLQVTPEETLTDIQRAARFFYLQHSAFGGRVDGQTYGVATTAPPGLNLLRIEENLSTAHLRLASAYIENLPWQDCIRRYDRSHTFFFMDPILGNGGLRGRVWLEPIRAIGRHAGEIEGEGGCHAQRSPRYPRAIQGLHHRVH
ncbi:D12 class N6 adenine-specific DNA methyltransferase [Bordetella bronchiseptica RB630]|nr:D12 class N6 adenine-specific DNA methyltransferase [Bordetella bronchiseptica RB630]KDD64541.1 D12 class N6 adenine-specific DNA methyltransferase [Bordetella bronchiseptica OSU553]